jgi:hypothetical protein
MRRALPTFTIAVALMLVCFSASHARAAAGTVASALATLSFQRIVIDATSPNNSWIKSVADLSGDGLPDLIVGGSGGPIVWYQAPTWTKRVISTSGGSESGSAVGDIDRDSDIDVVVGKTWYENVGGGISWIAHTLPSGTAGTHDINILDVNADGLPDIIMRGETASVVTVYLQGATPTTWTSFNIEPAVGRNGLDVADINADGRPDIAVGGVWMENPGGNVALTTWPLHTFVTGWHAFAAVKIVDMDADLRPDIVLSVSEAVGNVSWFKAPVDPRTGPWIENLVATGLDHVHAFAVQDMDKDGFLDVVTSEYAGLGRLSVYQGSGSTWTPTNFGTDAIHNIRAADVDADGDVDLFGAASYGVNPVILYRSNLATSAPPTVATSASANPNPATGGTTALSVLGADDGGEAALTYTWAATGTPPAPVTFSPNITNAAKNSTATFTQPGSYTLEATIADAQGQSVKSSVVVDVAGFFTTFAKINFQPAGAPIPSGYLTDTGNVFASRGNGLSYGWNVSHTDNTRDRNVLADQRLDTLCHFHAGGKWEIQVPNGSYSVFVSIGDASFSSAYTLNVENVSYWNNLSLATNGFASKTMQVTVSDGRLTLDQGSAVEKATRINYIEITGL